MRSDARLARATAQRTKPGTEDFWIDAVLLRKPRNAVSIWRAGDLGRSSGAVKNLLTLCSQPVHRRAHVTQRKVQPARRNEPRVLPNSEIVFVAIARIGGDEIKCRVFSSRRRRNLEAHFPAICEGCNGDLPSLGSVALADVTDLRETPECLLPCCDALH